MAISTYGHDHGFTGIEFANLITLVREMDAEFLAWQSEQKPPTEGK